MDTNDSNQRDFVGRDKILLQVNLGDHSTYIAQQMILYPEKKIPRALTKPPFQAEVFLGRKKDLDAIQKHFFSKDSSNSVLLLVNGQGGIGKSTLAAQYYDRYKADYMHTAWVGSEKSIANALLTHLTRPLSLSFEPTMPEKERLDLLLAAMDNLAKPCLLVLDNANELEDLAQHYFRLRSCRHFHWLLTSRIAHFEQAKCYVVGGLSESVALTLFQRYFAPLSASEKTIFGLMYQAVGGNTLVIELLAKNLAWFNRLKSHYSLADLLNDLQTKGLLSLSKSTVVATGYHTDSFRQEKPEAIIAGMYDLSALSREEVVVLSVFSVLPAERIEFETCNTLLPNMPDLENNALTLAQKGWIDFDKKNKTFKCSPVVQAITRMKNLNLRDDCQPLIKCLIEKLDSDVIHENNYKDSTLLAHYGESIVAVLVLFDYNLTVLCERIGIFYSTTGNLKKALFFYEKSCQVMGQLSKIHSDNQYFKNGLAISFAKLGNTYTALGNLDAALQFYEAATILAVQLCEKYPLNVEFKNGLAISHCFLANTYDALSNFDDALLNYKVYLNISKELFDLFPLNVKYKNDLAIAYSKLGDVHMTLGNLDEVCLFYKYYFDMNEQLCENYPENMKFKHGLAISYRKLGEAQSALGDLEAAFQFYKMGCELSETLCNNYSTNAGFKNELANSYYHLGKFKKNKLNDTATIRFYFGKAEALWLELVRDAPMYAMFQNCLEAVQNDLKDLDFRI